jgi:hypothetical protein
VAERTRSPTAKGCSSGTADAAASVAAIPANAAPAERDPVFGLIEADRAASARFDGIEDVTDEAAFEAAGQATDAALNELTSTPPQTMAGMRAVIEYLLELDGHVDCLPTLLRSSISAVTGATRLNASFPSIARGRAASAAPFSFNSCEGRAGV